MCIKVLNEVVVDRGPSSYLSNVDLYLDGRLITSVQGDGEHRHTLQLQTALIDPFFIWSPLCKPLKRDLVVKGFSECN